MLHPQLCGSPAEQMRLFFSCIHDNERGVVWLQRTWRPSGKQNDDQKNCLIWKQVFGAEWHWAYIFSALKSNQHEATTQIRYSPLDLYRKRDQKEQSHDVRIHEKFQQKQRSRGNQRSEERVSAKLTNSFKVGSVSNLYSPLVLNCLVRNKLIT